MSLLCLLILYVLISAAGGEAIGQKIRALRDHSLFPLDKLGKGCTLWFQCKGSTWGNQKPGPPLCCPMLLHSLTLLGSVSIFRTDHVWSVLEHEAGS